LPPPFEAVVFDLDGTLIDSAPDLCALVNEMLAEVGRPGLDLAEVRRMIGDGARALLERGLRASGGVPPTVDLDALFAEFLRRYARMPVRPGQVHNGVVRMLEALTESGVRLGLCTNKPQVPTDRLLAALDLDQLLTVAIGGDALSVRKPAAGHLLAVLARLGVDAAGAALVGDSRTDVLTARAAGVPCVLVSFGYTPIPARELGADRVIDHMSELGAALDALGAQRSAGRPPAPA
jgi:phosphoglycolate phosphatase